jgi:hypothetical protein
MTAPGITVELGALDEEHLEGTVVARPEDQRHSSLHDLGTVRQGDLRARHGRKRAGKPCDLRVFQDVIEHQ